MWAADLKRELDSIITWSDAYSIVIKTKTDNDVLDLAYVGGDMIYLGVESVVYILILVFIENAERIFARFITSKIKPRNKVKYIQMHNNENNENNTTPEPDKNEENSMRPDEPKHDDFLEKSIIVKAENNNVFYY